jgi:hypothetical protein
MPTQPGKTLFSQHSLETQLNARVYALFELSPAEIRVIEESAKHPFGEVSVKTFVEGFVLALRPEIMYTQVRVIGPE